MEKKSDYQFFVEAVFPEQILPEERSNRYANPLKAELESKSMGTVTGGGVRMSPRPFPGEQNIDFAFIDVDLANVDEAISVTAEFLTKQGAPVGSSLSYRDSEDNSCKLEFGDLELLNIFIDEINLPDEVFENTDFDAFCAALNKSLNSEGKGEIRGHGFWDSETLIYFAGANADDMLSCIKPLVEKFDVMQNARVLFQRKDVQKEPKEIRLPFNTR